MTPQPNPPGPFGLTSQLPMLSSSIQAGNLPATIVAIANQLLPLVLLIVGVVAVFMIILGGLRYLMSGGDEKRVKEARATIINAFIGIILVVLSLQITHFAVAIGNTIASF
jgi:hypothetical protein